MKIKNIKIIFGLVILVFSLSLYFYLKNKFKIDPDKFEIIENIFIKRVDFFSKYKLLYIDEEDFTVISQKINKLAIKDSVIIFSNVDSPNELLCVNKNGEVQILFHHSKELASELKTPMSIFNQKLNSSPKRIMIEVLLIISIVSGLWLVVLIFNLERAKM